MEAEYSTDKAAGSGTEAAPVGSLENRAPLYTTFDISDDLERQRDVSRFIRSDSDDAGGAIARLDDTLDQAVEILTERYDTCQDYVPHHPVDWVSEDDVINSSFPGRAMVKAYILKLVSPDISGFDSLQWRLERNPDLAAAMGFDPGKILHHTTFATQWWERYRPDFREHARYEAARAALKCRQYDLEISDKGEDLIEEFDRRNTGEDEGESRSSTAWRTRNATVSSTSSATSSMTCWTTGAARTSRSTPKT